MANRKDLSNVQKEANDTNKFLDNSAFIHFQPDDLENLKKIFAQIAPRMEAERKRKESLSTKVYNLLMK